MLTSYFCQGATIFDQIVCIAPWGQYEEASSFWNGPSSSFEDDYVPMVCIFILCLIKINLFEGQHNSFILFLTLKVMLTLARFLILKALVLQ